jgi:hypothetical protein
VCLSGRHIPTAAEVGAAAAQIASAGCCSNGDRIARSLASSTRARVEENIAADGAAFIADRAGNARHRYPQQPVTAGLHGRPS